MTLKSLPAVGRGSTQEHNGVAKGGAWTSSPSAPIGLVVADSDSRGTVLGRWRAATIDAHGGHYER